MKIKMFIPIALILCLAFSLCACGTTANTNETTTAPAQTTAAVTTEATAATTTAAATTAAETEAEADNDAAFTEDDALELVKNTYSFGEDYYFVSKGIVNIDGTDYYAVDLRKSNDGTTTYMSSFFVTTDGAEIEKGYTAGGVSYIGSDEDATVEISEDNAVAYIYASYDFEEGCFLVYKGTEEIDGTTYYAVNLMKSLESNTTYLSSYFVTADGTIVEGYYAGGEAFFNE